MFLDVRETTDHLWDAEMAMTRLYGLDVEVEVEFLFFVMSLASVS